MVKIKAPAIKTASGKVVTAKPHKHHDSINATGKKGFALTDGTFAGREKAAKIAKAADQVKPKKEPKVLHSHMLKGR